MGKQQGDGESEKRRAERETARRQKNEPVGKSSGITRNNFLRKSGLAALGLLAAGGTYFATRQEPQEPASSYLTVSEAVGVYGELQKIVERNWKEAQAKGKPLKIFVLENLESVNAYAYEMMLIDIADRLVDIAGRPGMKALLIELGHNDITALVETPLREDWRDIGQEAVQAAAKRKWRIENTDQRYATSAEENEAYYAVSKQLAEAELARQFGKSCTVTVIPGNDPNSLVFPFNVNSPQGLSPQEQEAAGRVVVEARKQALADIQDERNKAILGVLRRYLHAVVITGAEHGEGLIEQLQLDGEIILPFTLSDKKLELVTAMQAQRVLGPELKKRDAWAKQPANAVQFRGKEFPPKDTAVFIERVIEKANSMNIAR